MKGETYFFDERLFKEYQHNHDFLLIPLNNLVKAYNNLGLEKKFDREMLLAATSSTDKWIEGIRDDLRKTLGKTSLPRAFHNAFEGEIKEQTRELFMAANEVLRYREITMKQKLHKDMMVQFDFFDINSAGRVFIPDESIKKMKEFATMRVTNEAQIKVLHDMEAVNGHIEAIKKVMEANGINYPATVETFDRHGLFQFETGKYKIVPDVLRRVNLISNEKEENHV